MDLDPLLLSRIQFAFVVSFHILFPAFTIGLASFIALLETLWVVRKREIYFQLSELWTRIFAVSFGMGVVSGIVMSYQFGTNWSRFSDITGNVLGPLMGYEVLMAFFLEATFLGILLFGRKKVPPALHVLAAYAVAIGTLLSAFWILSANSWMHTPDGFRIEDGRFFVTSWMDAIFNPSFPYRFAHMVIACYLTTALVVSGVCAWYLLKQRSTKHARLGLSMGLGLITVLAPTQILVGDLHGLNTFEYQPAKVAAMEGHWETQTGAPLLLFAVPDMEAAENHYEIAVPYLGSLILTHELLGEIRGLKAWPRSEWPYVPIVFYAFRIMVGLGLLMLFLGMASLFLRRGGRVFRTRWFLKLCVTCTPIGFIALLAGWFVTETGRQPWTVYGLLRTEESVSPGLAGGSVFTSLMVFLVAYAAIFGAGIYYMTRLVKRGPAAGELEGGLIAGRRELSASKTPMDVEDR